MWNSRSTDFSESICVEVVVGWLLNPVVKIQVVVLGEKEKSCVGRNVYGPMARLRLYVVIKAGRK